jgi:ATP-dependent DNA helicase RecG
MRSKVAAATGEVPHILVMTATPIPRTLSLTVFGDLDVSVIRSRPAGRQPITTRVVGRDKEADVYRFVRSRIDGGEQCYVVVPAVEESATGLKDAEGTARTLAAGVFAGLRVGVVHGQMDREVREATMDRFRRAELDVLVATVVIEVGVDVPNASIMVVEHADRFGLAQLHQLRGRVGRGTRKSLCVFIGDPITDDATMAVARLTMSQGARARTDAQIVSACPVSPTPDRRKRSSWPSSVMTWTMSSTVIMPRIRPAESTTGAEARLYLRKA